MRGGGDSKVLGANAIQQKTPHQRRPYEPRPRPPVGQHVGPRPEPRMGPRIVPRAETRMGPLPGPRINPCERLICHPAQNPALFLPFYLALQLSLSSGGTPSNIDAALNSVTHMRDLSKTTTATATKRRRRPRNNVTHCIQAISPSAASCRVPRGERGHVRVVHCVDDRLWHPVFHRVWNRIAINLRDRIIGF